MSTQKTTRYPIDVTDLKKGDVIGIDRLKAIIKHPVGSPKWNFGLVNLCQFIMAEKQEIGDPMTACVMDGNVCLLTDPQAAEYNNNYFSRGYRSMFRGLNRQVDVDVRNLSDEQKKLHLRRVEVNSRTAQAAYLGRHNKLKLIDSQRKTPAMLENY